jgi:hypothetical protein
MQGISLQKNKSWKTRLANLKIKEPIW